MSIIFVRHGETPLNAARIMQPPATGLSSRGLEQALRVADRLCLQQPMALLSSDMPRAMQTADAIAARTGLPVVPSPLLRERNFGDLRGVPYDSLGFDPLTMKDAPTNGESMIDFEQRVAAAFADVVERRLRLSGSIVVVSHGLWIKAALSYLSQLHGDIMVPERIGNTSVTILSQDPPHRPVVVNCTQHLDQEGLSENGLSLSGG